MKNKLKFLQGFICPIQLKILISILKSEESAYVEEKINEYYKLISNMPKTYETDGQGDKAVVYLHYFMNNADFYVTEKDKEEEQLQAFGLVSLNGNETELGYINIQELLDLGFELDLEWSPKTLEEIKKFF